MIPPESVALAGASWALVRLFGPAVDEVGDVLRRWTEYRLRNVARVAENAAGKVDPSGSGYVPLRVAMRIFDEGSYAEDEYVVDYLGGVLASSRSPVGRDDRGNTFASLVAGLSSYQLRSHYIVYKLVREALVGRGFNVFDQTVLDRRGAIYVPYTVYTRAMDFGPDEEPDSLFWHAMNGLKHEGLIRNALAGSVEFLQRWAPGVQEEGTVVTPSPLGVELFLWAHGMGKASLHSFLDPAGEFERASELDLQPGAIAIEDLTQQSDVEVSERSDDYLGRAPQP